MLGKRIINTGGVSCTTDTTQILDAGTTQSTALYRFEDNSYDTSESTGKFGKGASFDGYNSAIDVNNVSGLNSLTEVSVSFWFNWDDSTSVSNYGHMINIGDASLTAGDYFGLAIGDDGGSYDRVLYGYFPSPDGSASTGQTVTANVWHHVVLTYSGTTVKYYYDGSLIATQTKTALSLPSSGNGIFIGHYKYNGGHHFKGFLDQIRIFNKEISSSEVTTLYNETTSTVNTLQVLGDTSCIAAYTFEGNANDLSTNYNGTASNVIYDYNGTASNITYATGKFNKGAVFNGSNSVIDIENMRTVMGNNFTVSLWVKTPSTFASSGYPAVLSMYGYTGSGSAYGWDIEYNNSNKLSFYWVSSSGVGNYIQSSALSADTWYHVVAQKDSSSANLYINGQLDNDSSSISGNGLYYNNFNRMTIGAKRLNYGSTSGHISGMVDQVRLFTKKLNAGEISTLYNETTTSAASGTIDNPSTVAYYKMADGTDETGNYNGTTANVDFNVQGKYGFAGKFNGSSSLIAIGSPIPNTDTNVAISAWVKLNSGISGNMHITGTGITSAGSEAPFRATLQYQSANTFRLFALRQVAGTYYLADNSTLTDVTMNAGVWYHVVWSYNSTGRQLSTFLNGVAIDSNKAMSTSGSSVDDSTTVIGSFRSTSGPFFDGDIDQLRIFNKTISAAEVTALYNEIQCANTIDTPESYFNTKLYTGNGGTQALTGVGFAPGMTWIKARSVGYSHSLQDTLRGPGTSTSIYPDLNSPAGTYGGYGQISAFGTDGFTVASGGHATYPTAQVNQNGVTYASWNWKAASSNTTNNDGSITSTVRASQESGFSIVKYTGDGTAGSTVGHGLSAKPEFILFKNLDTAVNWIAYDTINNVIGYLDLNDSLTDGRRSWAVNNTDPTSTLVTLGNNQATNAASDFIMYCFHSVDGYQRIGSYTGNGSANGPFIYTGFEPAWIMIKRTDAAGAWNIFDNKRNSANPRNSILQANVADQEYTNTNYNINFYTNGFQFLNSTADWNASGGSYIFMAIAANPDTTAPTKANSFKTKIYTGNGSTRSITDIGFKPDFTWIKKRANDTKAHRLFDSVRGANNVIYSNLTNVAATPTDELTAFIDGGFSLGNASAVNDGASDTYVAWSWKGLDHDRNLATINNDGSIPSIVSANPDAGFSVVKWTGTGVDGTKIGHGLQGSPEMIITKGLSNATSWVIGVGNISGLSINDYFTFTSYAKANSSTFYQAYSTNTFQVGVSAANEMNKSSSNQYISYCFRTIAGHSKVGKYTGTGVSGLEIALDFSPSFLLVKGAGATGWIIIDNQRPTPGGNYELYPHLSNTEDTSATSFLLGTNKFTVNSTGTWYNTNGTDYIYLAVK